MFFSKTVKKFVTPNRGEHQPDKSLITVILLLIVFGLVMLSSASSVISYLKYQNIYHYFSRQALFVLIGLALMFFFAKKDYHIWLKYAGHAFMVSIVLLLLVFIPGIGAEFGTARSWISIFGFSFQPSELVKLTFLIYLSGWIISSKDKINTISGGFLPFVVTMVIIAALMALQPDLGTLLVISSMSLLVFFVGGAKLTHLISLVSLAAIFLVTYLLSSGSYQSDRLKCYVNPSDNRQKECYQINQSLIAVGSGEWIGRGLGQSRQKFMYLPEVWGDSIFPIISEEIGFIFSSLFLLLMLFLFYRILQIAKNSPDNYGRLLAVGVASWLSIQSFLNIGGQINLIPMTGVPLPFVSSGGSSAVSVLIALGIIINISKQTKNQL